MADRRFFSLEGITTKFYTGNIMNEEMRKRDFRKAMQITVLSILSSLIVTVLLFLLEFNP